MKSNSDDSRAASPNHIILDESQLGNLQILGASLFEEDASDPRSWNYRRQLVRPKIHWLRILLILATFVLGLWGIYCLLCALRLPSAIAIVLCTAAALAIVLAFLKRILICIVRIYQRYAPDSLRNKCRFEPSCSQYMILSLEKYGLWCGLKKGIDRLKRCNTNGGGFDYP